VPTVGAAFNFLDAEGPAIFGTSVGSMLYVGHRSDTSPWWHSKFARAIGVTRLAVIDIDVDNMNSARHITGELYHGDIRQTDAPSGFGIVFWDEGPEHLPKDVSLEICHMLAERNRHVLISCPWGLQRQGSPDSYEFHHWGPEIEDFQGLGWQVRVFGERFVPINDSQSSGHGNLIAWI
jgi:hypothetical protein